MDDFAAGTEVGVAADAADHDAQGPAVGLRRYTLVGVASHDDVTIDTMTLIEAWSPAGWAPVGVAPALDHFPELAPAPHRAGRTRRDPHA